MCEGRQGRLPNLPDIICRGELHSAPAGAAKFFLVPGVGANCIRPPDGPGRGRMFVPELPNLSTFAAGLCRSREVWARYTVYQLQAGLQGSIYSISAPNRLAWPRYTVYQPQTGLHGFDIQYISSKQACMASIYSISAPNRLAWPRYTVYQPRADRHGFDIHSNIGYTSLNDYDFINPKRNETHKNH